MASSGRREESLLIWASQVSVSPTRRGLETGHPLSLKSVPFWVALELEILPSYPSWCQCCLLTTNHSIIPPMVASTLQCIFELLLHQLLCEESQGGHPDRGRASAGRPKWGRVWGARGLRWLRCASEKKGSRRIGRWEVGAETNSGRVWKTTARSLDFIRRVLAMPLKGFKQGDHVTN